MSSVSHPVRDISSRSFSDLSLDPAIIDVLRRREITVPTAVQLAVIPDAAHCPQFENEPAWWAALSGFLERL